MVSLTRKNSTTSADELLRQSGSQGSSPNSAANKSLSGDSSNGSGAAIKAEPLPFDHASQCDEPRAEVSNSANRAVVDHEKTILSIYEMRLTGCSSKTTSSHKRLAGVWYEQSDAG